MSCLVRGAVTLGEEPGRAAKMGSTMAPMNHDVLTNGDRHSFCRRGRA